MATLYIMRHGEAEPPGPEGDAARALSLSGMRALEDSVKGLERLDVRFDLIVCSPLLRTRQTAGVMRKGLGVTRDVEALDVLRPGAMPSAVLDELAQRFGEAWGGQTLVVGHMPDVSYLVGYTTAGREVGTVSFSPGTVACVEFVARPRAEAGAVRWVLTPDVMFQLGLVD